MTCEQAGVLLDAYVDNELSVSESVDVEGHLKACRGCARVVENHQALRQAMQDGSFHFQAPPIGRVMPPAPQSRRIYSWAAIAASFLLAGVLAGFWAGRWQPGGSTAENSVLDSHLRSLIPGHLADVESTDQHTVKPWFAGKLDFSPPVADFAQQGFPLTGGRVDSIEGRQVAALIYKRNRHVVNVYVWPASQGRRSRIAKATDRGYNIVHWTGSGFEWWAISDLNQSELEQFAELLR